jgi:hypothetical protein
MKFIVALFSLVFFVLLSWELCFLGHSFLAAPFTDV